MIFHAWGETAAPSGGFGRSLDRDDPYEAKKIKFTEERAGAIEIEVSNNGITGGVLVRSTSRSIVQFKSVIVRTGDTFTLTFEKATVGP